MAEAKVEGSLEVTTSGGEAGEVHAESSDSEESGQEDNQEQTGALVMDEAGSRGSDTSDNEPIDAHPKKRNRGRPKKPADGKKVADGKKATDGRKGRGRSRHAVGDKPRPVRRKHKSPANQDDSDYDSSSYTKNRATKRSERSKPRIKYTEESDFESTEEDYCLYSKSGDIGRPRVQNVRDNTAGGRGRGRPRKSDTAHQSHKDSDVYLDDSMSESASDSDGSVYRPGSAKPALGRGRPSSATKRGRGRPALKSPSGRGRSSTGTRGRPKKKPSDESEASDSDPEHSESDADSPDDISRADSPVAKKPNPDDDSPAAKKPRGRPKKQSQAEESTNG